MYLNLEAFPSLMGLNSLHLFLQYKYIHICYRDNDIEVRGVKNLVDCGISDMKLL